MASVKTMARFPLRQVPTRHQKSTEFMSVHELEVQWGEKNIFLAFLKSQHMGTCWESFPLGDLMNYRGEGEGQALVQSVWRCNETLL